MRYIKASSPIKKHETLKNNDIVYFLSEGRRGVGTVRGDCIIIQEKFNCYDDTFVYLFDTEKIRIVSATFNPEYFI